MCLPTVIINNMIKREKLIEWAGRWEANMVVVAREVCDGEDGGT